MISWITDPQAWMALLTLTVLEIALGIDNIIVLTILVGRLPPQQRQLGRLLGLGFAMATRIALLFSLVWMIHLVHPLFSVFGIAFSGRDLILLLGGLFLIAKSLQEIISLFHGNEAEHNISSPANASFWSIVIQIGLIDIIFSLDSVITAVGLANQITIMVIAIVIAVLIMMFAAKAIGDFVDKNPTIKMLALCFLILLGIVLIAEGCNLDIDKNYLYSAMGFSLAVEMMNLKLRGHINQR